MYVVEMSQWVINGNNGICILTQIWPDVSWC